MNSMTTHHESKSQNQLAQLVEAAVEPVEAAAVLVAAASVSDPWLCLQLDMDT